MKEKVSYSNVELLEIIKTSADDNAISKAKRLLNSRNLSEEELNRVELNYQKYRNYKLKRQNDSLTYDEWLTFFLFSFFSSKKTIWENEDFSETEIERFKKHGYQKKLKQAQQTKLFGLIFWALMIFLFYFITNYK